MNTFNASGPSVPEAAEIERIYPDLASLIVAIAPAENGIYSIRYKDIADALHALGHRQESVFLAVQSKISNGVIVSDSPGEFDESSAVSSTISVPANVLNTWKSIALALSGGGLRATLFQLGILLYLALADELKHVRVIVSVSGGSILAAFLAMHWNEAIGNPKSFVTFASRVVKATQRNIRDSAAIRFVWSRLLIFTWFFRRWSRTAFLEREYNKLFAERTLDDFIPTDSFPQFAFMATDSIKQRRVAIMPQGIRQFELEGGEIDERIIANGVHLSLAVTASSCFPPVFGRMRVRHHQLGIGFDEFKETLKLNDGGVTGNLGIEVLSDLVTDPATSAKTVLICDSERALTDEPANTPLADSAAQGAALSAAARQRTGKDFGPNAKLLRFAKRVPNRRGLPFLVETALRKYRTDLDKPSWQECQALLIQGAAICESSLAQGGLTKCPTKFIIRERIKEILAQAGAPEKLPECDERSLRFCSRRPKFWLVLSIVVVLAMLALEALTVCEIVDRVWPGTAWRPLTRIYRSLAPEQIVDLDINELATEATNATCNNCVDDFEGKFKNGALRRVTIDIKPNGNSGQLAASRTLRPLMCDREITCEFTFRGQFGKTLKDRRSVTIVGRIIGISPRQSSIYIDFGDCYVESTGKSGGNFKPAP